MRTQPIKRPIGRPTAYSPDLCDRMVEATATGLSLDAAAAEIGISPRSAYKFQRDFREFAQAVEEGQAKALAFWEKRAIAVANGKPGNAAIISLGLRNRSRSAVGWHEAVRTEHAGVEGQPVQVEQKTTIDTSALNHEQLLQLRGLLLLAKDGATKTSQRG
jgi:hypothetical protein